MDLFTRFPKGVCAMLVAPYEWMQRVVYLVLSRLPVRWGAGQTPGRLVHPSGSALHLLSLVLEGRVVFIPDFSLLHGGIEKALAPVLEGSTEGVEEALSKLNL